MKKLVLYYTFGGASKRKAEGIASENQDTILCEVKEKKKRNLFSAFFPGCSHAMKRIASEIEKLSYEPADFERIIIVTPIWAGYPVPAFNAILKKIPDHKEIELFFCSGSGETKKSEEGTKKMIQDMNCNLIAYHDVKTANQ